MVSIGIPHSVQNCAGHYKSGDRSSGVYTIAPAGVDAFDVFCDQTTAGGGWTVFQKRLDGSVDFYRNWADYKQGFGDLSGEFWLGLAKTHRLTSQTNNTLRVELEDLDGNTAYAEYDTFAVTDEADNYRLSVAGYTGNHRSVDKFDQFRGATHGPPSFAIRIFRSLIFAHLKSSHKLGMKGWVGNYG